VFTNGSLAILEKASGGILVNYILDANVHGGEAIGEEYIMFGTGYRSTDGYYGTGSVYVLEVDSADSAKI